MTSVHLQTGTFASDIPANHPLHLLLIRPLLLFSFLVLAISARAMDFNYTAANGQVTITGYRGVGGAVIVPSTIEGLPVTRIGDLAFQGMNNVTSVEIPAGIISIGEGTFWACYNLNAVTLPSGLTSLPPKLFWGCQNLTNISIPPSVTSIGANAFDTCTQLSTIPLPSGLEEIGEYAFNCCYKLKSISLPDSLLTIGDRAFSSCPLETLNIPAGVTQIGKGIIAGCFDLSGITVEAANLHFSTLDGILYDHSMAKILAVPCNKTGSFTIPDGVSIIGPMAFVGCAELTDVAVPPSVTSIMDDAFTSCRMLETMTIPATVTSIGKNVFQYCTNLTSVVFTGNAPAISPYAFASTRSDLTSYYHRGATGFNFWWPSLLAELAVSQEILLNGPSGESLIDGNAAIDFGYLLRGYSKSKVFNIINMGATPLTGIDVKVDGDGASDFTIQGPGKTILPPGDKTTFTVTFTGHTGGSKSAMFHVLSDDADESSFDVQLSGICTPEPVSEITVTRNGAPLESGIGTFDMGNVDMGTLGTADFTITNSGTGDMLISGIDVDGASAADFTVHGTLPPALSPGQSITCSVRFTPSGTGIRNASLHIVNNDPDETSFDIALTGVGTMSPNAEIAVFPSSGLMLKDGSSTVSFDPVMEGTRSASQTFTVTNHGLKTLQNLYVFTSGTDASEFIVSPLDRNVLTPGESTTFTIISAPKDSGTNTATLSIYSNDADENPFEIQLSASGTPKPPAPEIAFWLQGVRLLADGSSLGFGSSELHVPVVKTFVIYNNGTANLENLAVTMDGSNATEFKITALSSSVILPGQSAGFQVKFTPVSTGAKSAMLHLASNDSDEGSINVSLSGEGTSLTHPEIAVTLSGVDLMDAASVIPFGRTLEKSSNLQTLDIWNKGDATLRNLAITIDGPDAASFSIQSFYYQEVMPRSIRLFLVRFTPTKAGDHNATLHILNNDADESSFDLQLTGTAIPNTPEIDIQQPAGKSLTDGTALSAFGPAALKTTVTQFFTIRNVGGRDLSKITVKKDGPNADDFIVKQPAGTIMAPDTWMRFKVTFKPTAKGIRKAAIHIKSNDSDESPFDIELTGKGTAPASARESGMKLLPSHVAPAPGIAISRIKIDELNYRTLTVTKMPGEAFEIPVIEVSSNLINWYSGTEHTTVVVDDAKTFVVRDNTPFSATQKRHIRINPRQAGLGLHR